MAFALQDATALIIDPNPTSRSILCAQLRDYGMASVTQTGRIVDARKLLENRQYDVVLCEMDFHEVGRQAQTGQELLDELRQAGRLPWSTVFIMVTGERSYAKVAEAAESALDSYLLKPFTAQSLQDRVLLARQRKQVLEGIYEAIEDGRFEDAARLCSERFRNRERYWLYAARLGAELFLRLDMHTAAKHLLDAVVQHQALPWARLGIARAQLGQQQITPALRTLESLIHDEPTFVDAYDVMGRTQLTQGNMAQALETYRRAAELTPGALRRQQKLGMLAFYAGEDEAALKALDRAVILGQNSKMFDMQCLVLLAVLRFRRKDSKGLARCVADMQRAVEKAPMSLRLQRMQSVIRCFELMLQRQVGPVIELLKQMAGQIRRPDFDVEAGCNLLTTLAQLTAAELNLPDVDDWVRKVGERFAGSKGVSELLASAAWAHPPHVELVKQCHARISEAAERSLMHSVSGQPALAVEALLGHARTTLNQKFVDTARGVLKRYGEKMDDVPGLSRTLDDMTRLTGQRGPTPIPLGEDDSGVGGMRVRSAAAPAAP